MSWLDQVNTDLTIKTGDGKTYRPNWLNAAKQREFNVSEFNFVEVEGTLVTRTTSRGAKYNLEIIFQGDNHLEVAAAFDVSAQDRRPWTITHPYYRRLLVQPGSLEFDNRQHNVTKVTGTVIETISADFPNTEPVPAEQVAADAAATDEALATSFANSVDLDTADVTLMQQNNSSLYDGAKKFATGEAAESYIQAFSTANAAITNASAEPLAAMRSAQTVINAPALFATSVDARLTLLGSQFVNLRVSLVNTLERSQKFLYQSSAGSVLTGMAVTVANPQAGDFATRMQVIDAIETVLSFYNQYIQDLDNMQTNDNSSPDSFIPDADPLLMLSQLVNYTLSSLFSIALEAKQERSIILLKDTNWMELAHRLYGLLEDDSTLTTLMEQNNVGLSDLLIARANRRIIYYL